MLEFIYVKRLEELVKFYVLPTYKGNSGKCQGNKYLYIKNIFIFSAIIVVQDLNFYTFVPIIN